MLSRNSARSSTKASLPHRHRRSARWISDNANPLDSTYTSDTMSEEKVIERLRARLGTTVNGKYKLEALLGVGGMAAVYAATHRNGDRVALKVLHGELSRITDIRARFLREGYVANKIGHAGVVR